MNTFKLYEQLKAAFPKESAEALAHVLSEVTEEIQNTVTKQDFAELKAVVGELAQAQARTEERLNRLEAAVEKLAQAQQELAEAQQRTEETMQAGFRELNARFGDLDTRFGALDGRFGDLQAGFRDLQSRFGVVGSRWGDQAEETFRRGLLETVSRVGYTVEHYQGQDSEGFINYRPRSYDLDVLVHNGQVIVVEIKSNASGADVTEFHRSVLLFERQTGRQANQRILVAVTIQAGASEQAKELGIIVATDLAPVIG